MPKLLLHYRLVVGGGFPCLGRPSHWCTWWSDRLGARWSCHFSYEATGGSPSAYPTGRGYWWQFLHYFGVPPPSQFVPSTHNFQIPTNPPLSRLHVVGFLSSASPCVPVAMEPSDPRRDWLNAHHLETILPPTSTHLFLLGGWTTPRKLFLLSLRERSQSKGNTGS